MPPLETLIAFAVAASIFAYMPGPSMLYTAAQTLARGQRAGWFAASGIHIGGYAHVIAAAVGLSFLFEAVPILYFALKLAGAAYLIWLGVQMFRARAIESTEPQAGREKTAKRAFWESVSVEVLNPKTAIFYVAFLPQFVDPNATLAIWMQLLILGTIVNIMFSTADAFCVLLAGKVATVMRTSRRASGLAQRIGGGVLVALGVNLAFDRG